MSDPGRTHGDGSFELSVAGLDALFGYIDEAILCCDDSGTLRFASPAVRVLLGYDPQAVIGRTLLEFLHPDDRDDVAQAIDRWSGRAGAPRGESIRVRGSDGTWRILRYDTVIGVPVGPFGSFVITLQRAQDVDPASRSIQHRLLGEARILRIASAFLQVSVDDFDAALALALEELAGLEWVTRASVWVVCEDGDRVEVRAMWEAPANAPARPLSPRARISRSGFLRLLAAGEEVYLSDPWHHDEDLGSERVAFEEAGNTSVLAVPMSHDDRFVGFLMLESTLGDVAYDATHTTTLRSAAAVFAGALRRHAVEQRLAEQARTDRVTGLGNRWAFDEAIEGALGRLGSGASPGFGLALIDLDRFKLVNDALGHAWGDRLLGEVAGRLRSAADASTVVARLGGDELLVLVDGSPSVVDTCERVGRLVSMLSAPFDVGGAAMQVTASVGVLHADDADVTAGELLRRADVAMYRAKGLGGNAMQIDDPSSRSGEWLRLRREGELRRAVQRDDLLVYYQGEWDLRTGGLLGAEALVRWDHPTDGLLAAGDFVPLAEETGLIDQLGRLVLSDACRTAATWSQLLGPERFVLRVNLAAEQLRHRDLPDRVSETLADARFPARSLCLELTESTLLADPDGSTALFDQLREQGVGLAIDDFGTGYSSILQLKRLPLTSLKIDRSFVIGLPEDELDRAIVRSTVQLADALGVTVTAEGVETERQREALVELGCVRAQGFLLARPESADEFDERVTAARVG